MPMEWSTYLTNFLYEIYPCRYPFTLLVINKRPKTKMGCYIIDTKRIRIYAQYQDICPLEEIAIHEYAHHIHETELRKNSNRRQERAHGPEFWRIYTTLMCIAIQRNMFHSHWTADIEKILKNRKFLNQSE